MHMYMHKHRHVHECMHRGAPGKATLCMCVYIWATLLQRLANAMRQLPSHRVGRGELVIELAGHLLKQQIVDLKASKSEAQTRKTHATRRSRRRASLADLVAPFFYLSILCTRLDSLDRTWIPLRRRDAGAY